MPDLKSELNNNYSNMPMAGQNLPLTVFKFTYYPTRQINQKIFQKQFTESFIPKIMPIMVNAKKSRESKRLVRVIGKLLYREYRSKVMD
jgi:hypothetical protein